MSQVLAPAPLRPAVRFDEAPFLRAKDDQERLVVACILDEFSAQCFGPEAEFVPLTPQNWEVELAASQPDMLLVESAWRGHREQWWNTVPRLAPELQGILAWCRERNVPTAFWNKEDPVHFATFLRVAAEFDSVFTTDMDCVPRYKARLGHERVHFLPFAAQPALHNPLESYERVDKTAFAGAYYRKYPERTADLDALSAALRRRGGLAIFDRNYGKALPENEFPDDYKDEILGGLRPSEIGVAYKGYTKNLNLNSVKQSQSMFARRVFELMASNTLVVSNYSRGLRSMFGDLVISTDDASELERALDRLESVPLGVERVRVAALRKVMTEHTYGKRLSFMAEVNGVALPARTGSRVLVAARAGDRAEVTAVRDAVARQAWGDVEVALMLTGRLSDRVPEDLEWPTGAPTLVERLDVASVCAAASRAGCDLVTVFAPGDYYGRNHLLDAVLALEWTSLNAAGRARQFRVVGHGPAITGGPHSYVPHGALPMRASVVRLDALGDQPARRQLDGLEVEGLAIDPFNYCRGGAALPAERLASVIDLPLHVGHALDHMQRHAALATVDVNDGLGIALPLLLDGLTSRRNVDIDMSGAQPVVTSHLAPGEHTYVYSDKRIPLELLDLDTDPFVFFECTPGLDLMLALIFVGPLDERLGHAMVSNLRNVAVEVPAGAVGFRLGLRILGPGTTSIKRFIPHQHHEASSGILTGSRDIIATNIYPAYDNLYRNGFLHSRVRDYQARGHRVEVLVTNQSSRSTFREFEDVDVSEVPSDELSACLASGDVDSVLVHFLDPLMWQTLIGHPTLRSINVWVHGSEVQPWWRRAFNYSDEESLQVAKDESSHRVSFWQGVFREAPNNVRFVFVSHSFAESVFEDLGVRLPEDRYSIIPNPIDTSIFTYAPKPVEQRRRVLSIRPYASRTYANDLSVEAVKILSARPGFDDLQFCFIGDGPLFDETLEPLREFDNVEIRQQFLTHRDIASIHKEFGVFLCPTRMDSHGVSRDEAMASGLVPVTSAVAAVPEFVDAECGFLAESEDAQALADAIWTLAHDEERFSRMSAAAARRVASNTSADVIIPREMRLFVGETDTVSG